MPDIHIISGGKGGVGKTLCALCAALAKIRSDEQGLIIDLNYHNTDLAEIFKPLIFIDEDYSLADSGFKIAPIKSTSGDYTQDRSFLVYPDPAGKIFGRLPWEGGFSIYRHLNTILRLVTNGIGVDDHFEPSFCIVDTGLHLSNLNPQAPNKPEWARKVISTELNILNSFTPYIWFIWTIAMLGRHFEADAARATLRELAEINVSGEPWVTEKGNLIHVINPHVLIPEQKVINLIPKEEETIEALKDLFNANRVGPMAFGPFYRKVGRAARNYGQDRLEKYFTEIAKAIGLPEKADSFLKSEEEWMRPRNVLPIPYYKHELSGYTDKLAHMGAYSLKEIKDLLGDVYQVISKFLLQLE